jgi:succinate dehydrogenase/fumarate reductase flavoprotein subunit
MTNPDVDLAVRVDKLGLNSQKATWTDSSDVIIVGGGGAGLAAAVEATKRGASVILLEKTPKLGGTTGMAIGSISAAGTSVQRSRGIQDSAEAYLEDMARIPTELKNKDNLPLRKFVTFEAAQSLEWLRELGVSFHGPVADSHSRAPRMHIVVPSMKACVERLKKSALANGCRIQTNHEVGDLVRNDRGRVIGLVSFDKGSQKLERFRASRGVILAAGDYSSSSEVKRQFLSADVAEIEGINEHSTGDGYRLGVSVGAGALNMDQVYGPELRFVPNLKGTFRDRFPSHPLLGKMMAFALDILPRGVLARFATELLVSWQHPEDAIFKKGGILINSLGQRFTDETASPIREIAVAKQANKVAFLVLDQTMASQFSRWPNFISTAPFVAYAYFDDYKKFRPDIFSQAFTWQEASRRLSCDSKILERSVAEYNAAAESKSKDPWGRRVFGTPLTTPPFYILGPLKAYIPTTQGGLKVNEGLQVLKPSGDIIPGLYAAGTTGQGGLVHYTHGMGLAWAFTSGRLAGMNAAKAEAID